MKRLLIILFFSIPIIGFGQHTPLSEFFDKYSGQEGYTSVHITSYMFEIFKHIETDEEDREFKEAISNLTSIKILTEEAQKNGGSFKQELVSKLPKSIYKSLMIVKDGSETITFLIHEKKSVISEFVMLIEEKEEVALIFLEGDIDLNRLSKLSKSMKVTGFEHLDKIKQ